MDVYRTLPLAKIRQPEPCTTIQNSSQLINFFVEHPPCFPKPESAENQQKARVEPGVPTLASHSDIVSPQMTGKFELPPLRFNLLHEEEKVPQMPTLNHCTKQSHMKQGDMEEDNLVFTLNTGDEKEQGVKTADDFISFLMNYEPTLMKNSNYANPLHFNNPTSRLATRCDVVYKTLLRDCRKYFCELFGRRNNKCSRDYYKITKFAAELVDANFEQNSDACTERCKFYVRCMLHHKMLTWPMHTEPGLEHTGSDKEDPDDYEKAKHLHSILYAFSLEKCLQFFENKALCIIFKYYLRAFPERMETNKTIRKEKNVYNGALAIIMKCINKTLYDQ